MSNNNNTAQRKGKISVSRAEIEESQADMLKRLNIRTGQVKIGDDILWVDMGRYPEMAFRSKASMSADYADWTVLNDDGQWVNAFKWWLGQSGRRKFEEVIYDPARYFANGNSPFHIYDPAVPNIGALNLFTGWAIKKPSPNGSCDLFYEHLRENYSNGDPLVSEVALNWMAHLFQRPGKPIGWALAVVGDPGAGKSVVSEILAEIMGKRYSPVFTTPESLLGKFNALLSKCILARIEEAINPRDPRHIATLKNMLSGGDVMLEHKGIDSVMIPSRANFIFTSNDSHFLATGSQGERRYFAFRCGNGRQQDGAFFSAMRKEMEAGGYARLLHDLLVRDISKFDFTSPPRTAVLSTQIRAGLSGLSRWWADCLDAGELIFTREPETTEPLGWVEWSELRSDAFAPMKECVMASAMAFARDYSGRAPAPGEIGRFLADNAGAESYRARGVHGTREQRYRLPPLDACRMLFVKTRPGLLVDHVGGGSVGTDRQHGTGGEVIPLARTAERRMQVH